MILFAVGLLIGWNSFYFHLYNFYSYSAIFSFQHLNECKMHSTQNFEDLSSLAVLLEAHVLSRKI